LTWKTSLNKSGIKNERNFALTMVSKESDPHLHNTRIRTNRNVGHWSNRTPATFSHIWKTFSCTNWLQGYCKRLHASRQLGRLEYLKHILWPPESEKKLHIEHKLEFQLYNRGLHKTWFATLLPIPKLLYASTTPSVRT